MTVPAIQTGRKVTRVLASGGHTMTRVTPCAAGNGAVVEGGRNKSTRGMADAAILNGCNMVAWFTCRQYTVMTGSAVVDNANVIKGGRDKACGDMAPATIIVGRHMGVGFADGGIAIVTRGAVVHDARVIKSGAGKGHGVMTHRTVFCRRQMIWRHAD